MNVPATINKEASLATRDKIVEFEQMLSKVPGAMFGNQPVTMPLKHSFAGPIYVREIFIPKGSLVTGRIHLHEHPFFLMSGDVSIVDETYGSRRIKGPCHFISPARTKRLFFAHEDTVMVTVHHVGEERDIDKIEREHTAATYQELQP